MQIINHSDIRRSLRWASPTFDNNERFMLLTLSEIVQVYENNAWVEIKSAPAYATRRLDNTLHINVATLVVAKLAQVDDQLLVPEGETWLPFYQWLVTLTADELGVTDGANVVFALIAKKIEDLLTANNMW